ncbi:MAG: putative ATP-dependent helicase YprA [Gemmatimonadota bacterium]|nr:MAG: putative ATP-dependent helicase YprA [Gemmatimonadota bacterium]
MEAAKFLDAVGSWPAYDGQMVHVEKLPAREARFGELSEPFPLPVREALLGMGIPELWAHQARCVQEARAGKNVAVVTSTASGKTLAYTLPVLERLVLEPESTALFLYPTKALAQDQLRGLLRMAELSAGIGQVLKTGTYDGDTPSGARRKLRDDGNVILTNPDMLHSGVLPYHMKWSRFLANLHTVVIDEIHAYRGIFGSNVANVIRRLRRVCRHHGSDPRFLLGSATIANPHDFARSLLGEDVVLVDEDGSPRGPKQFVLWNPPYVDTASMERRSANVEGHRLFTELVKARVQTICFSRARVVAELIHRYTQEALTREKPELAKRVRPYRGGFLPRERREIEKALFSGELLGVSSTNALELGIDIGTLEASVVVGFPSTIASLWQQAGRAGRGSEEAVTFFVAYNDPIDQYLMRHPEYLFAQSPESAVIDPENPYILSGHLQCAAFELPLEEGDLEHFGEVARDLIRLLDENGRTRRVDGRSYWANTDFPSRTVNLRHMSDDTYTIIEVPADLGKGSAYRPRTGPEFQAPDDGEARVIGNVDAISALELLYPEAVYLHDGETFVVRHLDLEGKSAYVERRDVDYYTTPVLEQHLLLRGTREVGTWAGADTGFGDATVTWFTSFFKKIQFFSVDSIGWGNLDLPPQNIDTTTAWITIPAEMRGRLKAMGKNAVEGLVGVRNLLISVVPLWAMCDRADIGGVVDSKNLGKPTIFLYDRYPGGLGFVEHAFRRPAEIFGAALALVSECPCESGCPSCVGLPVLRPAQHQDPEAGGAWPIPDKDSAHLILEELVRRSEEEERAAPREAAVAAS